MAHYFKIKTSLALFLGCAYNPQVFFMRGVYHWGQEACVLDSPQSLPSHVILNKPLPFSGLLVSLYEIKTPSSSVSHVHSKDCTCSRGITGSQPGDPTSSPGSSYLLCAIGQFLLHFWNTGFKKWCLCVISTQISRRILTRTPWTNCVQLQDSIAMIEITRDRMCWVCLCERQTHLL